MSNLIITIIGIVLVAVIALIGLFYGGVAFTSQNPQARAAMFISQSRQMMVASTQYMLDKGYGDFNSFGPDAPAIANYTSGRVGILSMDIRGYVAASSPHSWTALNANVMRHETVNPNTGLANFLDGVPELIFRTNCNINGNNAIVYWMTATTGTTSWIAALDYSQASSTSDPLVQMCLKINAKTTLPAGLTYSPSGLPYAVGSAGDCGPIGNSANDVEYDTGFTQPNYCYINTNGYFGTNKALGFIFMN